MESAQILPASVTALLAERHNQCDEKLEELLTILSEHHANECWHKAGTFKHHLFGVWRILYVWNQSTPVCRCGLFHSAYSNSYVNLAIFKPDTERNVVQECVGLEAEELIHKFCIIPRHSLIYEHLLPLWAEKKIPAEGLALPHIRNKDESVRLSPYLLKICLILTMADFADQIYHWQDRLFENYDGGLRFSGKNSSTLWPGVAKPGLWMSCISEMGQLAKACEAFENTPDEQIRKEKERYGEAPLPPVFDHCTEYLSRENEKEATDLYWGVICLKTEKDKHAEAEADLLKAVQLNPWIAEPHVLLAQIHLCKNLEGEDSAQTPEEAEKNWQEAIKHATKALELFSQWGCAWDKRIGWEGWISWARVLLGKAKRKERWPLSPFGIINLGLVE